MVGLHLLIVARCRNHALSRCKALRYSWLALLFGFSHRNGNAPNGSRVLSLRATRWISFCRAWGPTIPTNSGRNVSETIFLRGNTTITRGPAGPHLTRLEEDRRPPCRACRRSSHHLGPPRPPPIIQKVPHLEGTGHELVMFGRRSAVVKRREFSPNRDVARTRPDLASRRERSIFGSGGVAGSYCRLSDAVDDPSAPFEFFATNVFGTKRLAIALPTGNSTICPALNHVFLFTQTRVA
jgi:hypothetical protein